MLYIIQAIDECWFIIKIILTFYLYNNIMLRLSLPLWHEIVRLGLAKVIIIYKKTSHFVRIFSQISYKCEDLS